MNNNEIYIEKLNTSRKLLLNSLIYNYNNNILIRGVIMNDVLLNIQNRRSVRKYGSEQIKREELDQILEAAIAAPSACNEQPWFLTIIQNSDIIKEISSKTLEEMKKSPEQWIQDMGEKCKCVFYNAPTVIVVSGKDEGYSPITDCSAAIQNMLLAAESLNIGSVWIGLTDHYFRAVENYREKLSIPNGYTAFYTVALGYKLDNTVKPGPRKNTGLFKFI